MTRRRLSALRALLAEQGADAVIVNRLANLQYFSGFRGEDALLVVSGRRAILVTDSRYTEQAAAEAPGFEVVEQKDGLWQKAADCLKEQGAKAIGFEENGLLFCDYRRAGALLERVELKPLRLDPLRQVKDAEEISCIREACRIADSAFNDVLRWLRPGIAEREVAARLERFMQELGSERPAFPTIVASGSRGSLAHGVATEKLIASGEFVTMDFGAVFKGYHSDITRTVCVGRADERQRRVYAAVLRAQMKGLSEVRAGASGKDVDRAARECLAAEGLAEIHEEPRLSPKSTCEHLEPGMLVTVEPGVYIPGWGGVRIEDTVLVTESGGERLTTSGKELVELAV